MESVVKAVVFGTLECSKRAGESNVFKVSEGKSAYTAIQELAEKGAVIRQIAGVRRPGGDETYIVIEPI